MDNHFPFKEILISVSLQSILSGIQSSIILSSSNNESKRQTSFIVDLFSLFVVVCATLYTNRFKLSGRKGYFLKNSLAIVKSIQAICLILSGIYMFSSHEITKLIGFIILILQNVCRVNVLTTILLVVSLEDLEVGFYFGLQFLVFEISSMLGSVICYFFSGDISLLFFYYFVIVFYIFISYYISTRLSDENDLQDTYDWRLWLDIVKVRFFRMNFTSFSITLGVASYIYSIITQALIMLNSVTNFFIVASMLVTYPISLFLVYKYLRPIRNKAFIVFGLIFQSLALISLMVVYADNGKNTDLIALASPILSQIGLVFVTVSALPDMIRSTNEELSSVPKVILTDRVCSIVYTAYYLGKIVIIVFTFVLRETMSFEYGIVVSGICILIYAGVYEYFGQGVREFRSHLIVGLGSEINVVNEIDMSKI